MPAPAPERQDLNDRIGRWRRALADAATGPLIIAEEIVRMAERWEDFKDAADGLDCSAFLRKHLGKGRGLPFFKERATAVARLGEAVRRTVHHEVAVWASRNIPPDLIEPCKLELMRGAKEQNGNPLTLQQAKTRLREILGKRTPRKRECERCKELEEQLKAAGLM